MRKTNNGKTPLCPRCFKNIHSELIKCPNCGFQLVSGDEIIYREDLIDEKETKKTS